MGDVPGQKFKTLFSSEQSCVAYLFKKRWPWGFICPFCKTEHRQMAPAYTVVCRYCRKQTSITAHTMMHGTKKSLVAWMQISWQFCLRDKGISAREVQRIMGLASYQTAWRWLQKIRHGAALAESRPIGGSVLFDCGSLPALSSSGQIPPHIGVALEVNHPAGNKGKVRFALLASPSSDAIAAAINSLILKNTTLLLSNQEWISENRLQEHYLYKKASRDQLVQIQLLIEEAGAWLKATYRGAIDVTYMQNYLSEFSFRYNTATWSDRLSVFDHLLTGLMSSAGDFFCDYGTTDPSTRRMQ